MGSAFNNVGRAMSERRCFFLSSQNGPGASTNPKTYCHIPPLCSSDKTPLALLGGNSQFRLP